MSAPLSKVVVCPLVVWVGSSLGLILAVTECLTHPVILRRRRGV